MKPVDGFCLLLVDAAGRVVFQHPTAAEDRQPHGGCLGETVGAAAQDVLAAWIADPVPVISLDRNAQPARLSAVSRLGERLAVHFIPCRDPRELVADSDEGGAIIIVAPDSSARELRSPWRAVADTPLTVGSPVVASVAHEMNNLLMVMSGWLELLGDDASADSPHSDKLKKVAEATQRMAVLTKSLLNFTRAQDDDFRPVDINQLAQCVIALAEYQLRRDNIELITNLTPESIVVLGNEGELSQTLLNLIQNSRQAMPNGGKIILSTRRDDQQAVLDVRDTGCGIPPEICDRIFDPFFTTRRDEGGTGLGLSVCKEIVQRHGGEMSVESRPGAGALFSIRMPLTAEAVAIER